MRPGETSWFTLTSPPGEDFVTSHDRFQDRWHPLIERVRRKVGHFDFVAVIEPQRREAAHVHVVYRGRPISKRWLSEAASAVGFGHIVHVGVVFDGRLAGYLGKSLTAELGDASLTPPPYFHRVRFSRHWSDLVPIRPRRSWTHWYIVPARPAVAAASAIARGYEIVELVGADPPGDAIGDRLVARFIDLRSCLRGRHTAASGRALP